MIRPTGFIVPAARHEHIEECVWINVIANPRSPADLIIQSALRIEIDFPFLIHQAHFDAKILFPHLLNCLGDDAVGFQRVVEKFDGREIFPSG